MFVDLTREISWRFLREMGVRDPDPILTNFEIRQPPVPIFSIVEALGIRLHRLPMKVSGAAKTSATKAAMWINSEDAVVRQRFTAAHELGHILLHPLGVEWRDDFSSLGMHPREIESNRFAAELLMPEWLVGPTKRGEALDLQHLANIFEVSAEAMGHRLSALGMSF